jgi:hypothetical protein
MGSSGGLTPDNLGVEYSGVVFSIEESPITPGLIWVGTNDGLIHLTRDGGESWTDLTANVPGMPEWGSIRNFEASRYDAGTAYFAVDGHQANNRDPWLYRTRDYGETWELIVNGIEKSPLSYTRSILEDPVRQGLLYAGTENGLYVSFTDGDRWQPLQSNLPHAPALWLVIQEHFNDLVVGTYGRGFWILDDISAIQQLTPEVVASDAHIFEPRAEYRFRPTVPPYASGQEPTAGENPPYGASIDYWLSESAAAADSVTLEITDSSGVAIRSVKGGAREGINRVWWDLRHDASERPVLRTKPRYASWVVLREDGTRDAPGLGPVSTLVLPGVYTITLTFDGREYSTTLEVRKDPNSRGTDATVLQNAQMVSELRADLDRAVVVVNGAERIRAQLQSIRQLNDDESSDLRDAAEALEAQFTEVEAQLLQLNVTGRGGDGLRWPSGTAQRIAALIRHVESSDFAPTEQHGEVGVELRAEVAATEVAYKALMSDELAAFNAMLAARGMGGVTSDQP